MLPPEHPSFHPWPWLQPPRSWISKSSRAVCKQALSSPHQRVLPLANGPAVSSAQMAFWGGERQKLACLFTRRLSGEINNQLPMIC